MCDCIEKTTELIQQRVKEKVGNTVSDWINEGSFNNIGYPLQGGEIKIGMPFKAEYIKNKKDGTPERKISRYEVTMYPTYCPFCGKKYESDEVSLQ